MIWNFFKVCVRNLGRQRVFSLINILGLTIGLTAVLLIALDIEFEHSFNSFNRNADRIYRVGVTIYRESKVIGKSPEFVAALGPAMTKDFSEVENSVRMSRGKSMTVSLGDKSFVVQDVKYADSAFFDVFSLHLLAGSPASALANPFSIVLTQSTAAKLFGRSEGVGEMVKIDGKSYAVTGISEDPPANSDIRFNALVSFPTLYGMPWHGLPADRFLGWEGGQQFITYVELMRGASPDQINRNFASYLSSVYPQLSRMNIRLDAHLEPLTDLHLYYNDNSASLRQNMDAFSAIAIFILLIACLNFINLSTARATGRGKEVGMRKVLGADRKSLVSQFLAESILFAFIALVLALVSVELLLPWFGSLIGRQLLPAGLPGVNFFWILLAVLLVTGIGAGIYPALFLSSYQPVDTLKGNPARGAGRLGLRKSLVVLQFTISLVLLISTLVINGQLGFMRSMNLGYHHNNMLVIPLQNNMLQTRYEAFKNELRGIPGVEDAAASTEILGNGLSGNGYFPQGYKTPLILRVLEVDEDFMSTYGIKMEAGRNFSKEIPSDKQAYIINESLAKLLNWDDPVGKVIDRNGPHTVIGEVKDFIDAPLYVPVQPLVITDHPEAGSFSYVTVRIGHGDLRQIMGSIQKVWHEFAPSLPFDYFFLNQQFNDLYRTEIRFREVFLVFSGLAIFVALIGLLGLVSYTVQLRRKEIGVRKVLGSSVPGIMSLLSKEYVKWILVANVLAWPIAYFAMQRWLHDFAYRMNMTPWLFIEAAAVELVVAVLAMSFQAMKAATANPVESLRYE